MGHHGAPAVGARRDTRPHRRSRRGPTAREIAAAVSLASPSSALYHLRRLEEAGIVRRDRGAGSRDHRPSRHPTTPAPFTVPLRGA
ncbi:helix-turn-helix domain-containing protein [Streptomyces sp. bgisy031]|uniref:LexA family protein n=1 Tax=Streptomyces sp. bgisy031 TaxID=3413772 RepID=UPI003D725E54